MSLDASNSIESYVIKHPKYQHILRVESQDAKELLTIHPDGRITVSEDAQPTETAKLVLEAMQSMVQGMLRREYQRGYDDATEFQEGART